MEHILVRNIMKHLDKNNLINPSNTVFVANTVVNQLLSFTQEIYDKLEAGKQTALIVMKFRKAFNKVDLKITYIKHMKLGLYKHSILWIQSFLENRSQSFVVERQKLKSVPVMYGVRQGLVLGPCLFLCYINYLPDSVKSRARLFTDDTILYLTIDP